MCQTWTVAPASAADALDAVRAGLSYLASVNPADLTIGEQAELLRGLVGCESVQLAAAGRMFAAFGTGAGPAADGAATARSWLRWHAQISNGAAGQAAAWARRLQAHPNVAAALAAEKISVSYARAICDWTDELPDEHRDDADQVLLQAAARGLELTDLTQLAAEIRARTARPDTGSGDDRFERRWLRLTPHWRGHARLDGELTPECAAAVRAVLDALGGKAGPEDERSQSQRDHDALEEACRRLVAAGTLPGRAGQPTLIQLQMTLRDLLSLPGAGDAIAAWAGSGLPPAPPGSDCDALVQPVVTGHLDLQTLSQLIADVMRQPGISPTGENAQEDGLSCGMASTGGADALTTPISDLPAGLRRGTAMAARALGQLTIAQALALLSGPGSITSCLRTWQLSGTAAGAISLPLDVGAATDTIPAHLRRAITRRDQRCRFPGCAQPPAACHVHHLVPRSEGGTTSQSNCVLLCAFHHLIAIHRWGWQLTLNSDGTTTAVSPDRTRTYHSHAPPTAA
jgi:hypothetical protein